MAAARPAHTPTIKGDGHWLDYSSHMQTVQHRNLLGTTLAPKQSQLIHPVFGTAQSAGPMARIAMA